MMPAHFSVVVLCAWLFQGPHAGVFRSYAEVLLPRSFKPTVSITVQGEKVDPAVRFEELRAQ